MHQPIHHADLSEPLSLPLPRGSVMSLEVAEHLDRADESVFLDNLASLCSHRLILSWALPDACAPGRGYGHLNCRDNAYVIEAMFGLGMLFQPEATAWLRSRLQDAEAFWFKDTVMVFDRS